MEAPDRPLFDFCDQLEAVIPLVHTVHDDRLTDQHQASDFYRLPPWRFERGHFPPSEVRPALPQDLPRNR